MSNAKNNIFSKQNLASYSDNFIVTILTLSGAVIALAPKGLAPMVLLLAIGAAVNLWSRGAQINFPLNGGTISLIALIIWAGLSVFWAPNMAESAVKFVQIIGFILCLFPLWLYGRTTEIFQKRTVKIIFSLSFLASWLFTTLIVFNHHIFIAGISEFNAVLSVLGFSGVQMQNFVSVSNRAITILVPLSFVIYATCLNNKLIYWPLLAAMFFVIFHSNNQSALLGITVPVVCVLLIYLVPRFVRVFFPIVIVLAGLFVVPLSIVNYQTGLYQKVLPEIFLKKASASPRTDLYYAYAMASLDRPLLGHGLDTSSSVDFGETDYNFWKNKTRPHHPHNFFLQLFYEFGVLGLVGFFIILLNLGRRLEFLPVLASVLGVGFFAYNIWQSWFLGMMCLLFFISSALLRSQPKRF